MAQRRVGIGVEEIRFWHDAFMRYHRDQRHVAISFGEPAHIVAFVNEGPMGLTQGHNHINRRQGRPENANLSGGQCGDVGIRPRRHKISLANIRCRGPVMACRDDDLVELRCLTVTGGCEVQTRARCNRFDICHLVTWIKPYVMPRRAPCLAQIKKRITKECTQQHPWVKVARVNLVPCQPQAAQSVVVLFMQPCDQTAGDRGDLAAERVTIHVVRVHARPIRHPAAHFLLFVVDRQTQRCFALDQFLDRIDRHRPRPDDRNVLGAFHWFSISQKAALALCRAD